MADSKIFLGPFEAVGSDTLNGSRTDWANNRLSIPRANELAERLFSRPSGTPVPLWSGQSFLWIEINLPLHHQFAEGHRMARMRTIAPDQVVSCFGAQCIPPNHSDVALDQQAPISTDLGPPAGVQDAGPFVKINTNICPSAAQASALATSQPPGDAEPRD